MCGCGCGGTGACGSKTTASTSSPVTKSQLIQKGNRTMVSSGNINQLLAVFKGTPAGDWLRTALANATTRREQERVLGAFMSDGVRAINHLAQTTNANRATSRGRVDHSYSGPGANRLQPQYVPPRGGPSRVGPAPGLTGVGCGSGPSSWQRHCNVSEEDRCASDASLIPSVWGSNGSLEMRSYDFAKVSTAGQLEWNAQTLEGLYTKKVTSQTGTYDALTGTTTINIPGDGSWPAVTLGFNLHWRVGMQLQSPVTITFETTGWSTIQDTLGGVVAVDRKNLSGDLPAMVNGGDFYVPWAQRTTENQDIAGVKLGAIYPVDVGPAARIIITGAPSDITWVARPLGAFNTETQFLLSAVEDFLHPQGSLCVTTSSWPLRSTTC